MERRNVKQNWDVLNGTEPGGWQWGLCSLLGVSSGCAKCDNVMLNLTAGEGQCQGAGGILELLTG